MRELILLNIFGRDRRGVTSSVMDILEAHQAKVLDLGQAVIHDNLSLGMLIEIPNDGHNTESQPQSMLTTISERMVQMALQIHHSKISEVEYASWVEQQGKQRHIVTLLARQITASHIAALTRIVVDQGLNIDSISRLSGRISLEELDGPNKAKPSSKACIEFSARGTAHDEAQLRKSLAELAGDWDIDIAFQYDNMFRRTRRLVCFDMDSTLIETEVINELADAAGVGEKVAEITEAAMRGELDFNASFRKRMALLKGLDESVLNSIAEKLPITEGAEKLIVTLRKLGYKTAILSGGFTYFGEYLKDRLGIDYLYANSLEFIDGKLSGKVHGEIIDGTKKAELLKMLAKKEGLSLEQVVAVGDGANDLPMLSIAGLGIAFRAKPLVKAEAEQAISHLGLDAILYLMGFRDRDLA